MAINIQINGGIQNSSLQVGDYLFKIGASDYHDTLNNYTVANQNSMIFVGVVTSLNVDTITVDNTPASGAADVAVSADDFIMFSKDPIVNTSFLKGYYARVGLINNDFSNHAELFSVSSEVVQSSK
jgi:6-phosphogluconate dehydrogenase (decarboxylating)